MPSAETLCNVQSVCVSRELRHLKSFYHWMAEVVAEESQIRNKRENTKKKKTEKKHVHE